jgi:large subunit ribosomal protein L16
MLMPKKVKYRRVHRGRRDGKASGGTRIDFGDFALQALESCWMTNNQIEAARIAMTRHIRRGGKIWIRVFPDKPFTKKPAETRMGSGKGAPEGWVAVVKPGRILFEMRGVNEELAKEAMRLASHKLPINVRFFTRREQEAVDAGLTGKELQKAIAGVSVEKLAKFGTAVAEPEVKDEAAETEVIVTGEASDDVDVEAAHAAEPQAVIEESPVAETSEGQE